MYSPLTKPSVGKQTIINRPTQYIIQIARSRLKDVKNSWAFVSVSFEQECVRYVGYIRAYFDQFRYGITQEKVEEFRENYNKMELRTQLRIADILLNYFLLMPLIVMFTYGTCELLHNIFNVNFPVLGPFMLIVIGLTIEISASFFQTQIVAILPTTPQLHFEIATRCYNYVLAIGSICHFKGVGDLIDTYTDPGTCDSLRVVVTATVVLWGLKCGRNLIGPPFNLDIDTDKTLNDFVSSPTLYRSQPNRSLYNLLDNVATYGIIHSTAHAHWTGTWNLLGNILLPSNPVLDCWFSFVIGYSLTTLFIYIQPRLIQLSKQYDGPENTTFKIIFENVVILGVHFTSILVWRCNWIFFENLAYYFPVLRNTRDVTSVYASFVSFALLVMCHISSSLVGMGCDIDGTYSSGDGLKLQLDYLTHFFKDEIAKNEASRENKDSKDIGKSSRKLSTDTNCNIVKSHSESVQHKGKDSPTTPRKARRVSLEDLVKLGHRKSARK